MEKIELDGPATVQNATRHVVSDSARPTDELIVPPLEKPPGIDTSGFFNPGDPLRPYAVRLVQQITSGLEQFQLEEPIGYWDAHVGGIIVPANLAHFRTDLTSVPSWFTWLVPRTGVHLPAALIHDGLILAPDEPQTYIASQVIDRETADRIFRDGMRDLDTTPLRRWLIWSAVATASMLTGPLRRTWRGWLAVAATAAVVLVLGTLATIDLLDLRDTLPWMGDRPAWLELLYGAIGALVIPPLVSPLWGKRWQAGAIGGVAAAFLLHVTLAILFVTSLFSTAEAAIQGQTRTALGWLAAAVGLVAAVLLIGAWAAA